MKPGEFEYFDPKTIQEALALLAQYGDDAKVLAGGQSLVPMMNMRLARPAVIVDINRLPGLTYIEQRNGTVAIGALMRHRDVEKSPLLKESCALLPSAAEQVADTQVRNRGTFGGCIAHADPASEFCAVVLTLEGEVVVSGEDGSRSIPAGEFFLGPMMTSLEPTSLVTEVVVPNINGRAWSIRSVAPRHGDLAIAGVMAVLGVDSHGVCVDTRIGMYGVGPTPVRAGAAESILNGTRLEDRTIALAAEEAEREISPVSDIRATASYRKALIKRLVDWNLRNARDKLTSGRDN